MRIALIWWGDLWLIWLIQYQDAIAQASYTSIMHHYYSVLVNLLADLTFHQEAAATALAQEVAKQQVISLTSLISWRKKNKTFCKISICQYSDLPQTPSITLQTSIIYKCETYSFLDSSLKDWKYSRDGRDRSLLIQKNCATESQNCIILPFRPLTPLMKALKKNMYALAPKNFSAIAQRSFVFERQLSSLSSRLNFFRKVLHA